MPAPTWCNGLTPGRRRPPPSPLPGTIGRCCCPSQTNDDQHEKTPSFWGCYHELLVIGDSEVIQKCQHEKTLRHSGIAARVSRVRCRERRAGPEPVQRPTHALGAFRIQRQREVPP